MNLFDFSNLRSTLELKECIKRPDNEYNTVSLNACVETACDTHPYQ